MRRRQPVSPRIQGLEIFRDGKDEDGEGKAGGRPCCPSSRKEEAEGCREACREGPAQACGGFTPCGQRCRCLRPFVLPANTDLAMHASTREGVALLLWQAKKPVVEESSDDESEEEEDAPVNGAAAPATPAKVEGPLLLVLCCRLHSLHSRVRTIECDRLERCRQTWLSSTHSTVLGSLGDGCMHDTPVPV